MCQDILRIYEPVHQNNKVELAKVIEYAPVGWNRRFMSQVKIKWPHELETNWHTSLAAAKRHVKEYIGKEKIKWRLS